MTPAEVTEILRKFARARRADEYLWGTSLPGVPTEAGAAVESAIEMIERLEAAESSVAWHQRRWMALQMHQKKMRDPERTIVCDILANGKLLHPTVAGNRYSVMEKSK